MQLLAAKHTNGPANCPWDSYTKSTGKRCFCGRGVLESWGSCSAEAAGRGRCQTWSGAAVTMEAGAEAALALSAGNESNSRRSGLGAWVQRRKQSFLTPFSPWQVQPKPNRRESPAGPSTSWMPVARCGVPRRLPWVWARQRAGRMLLPSCSPAEGKRLSSAQSTCLKAGA